MVLISGAPVPELISANLPDRATVLAHTITVNAQRWGDLLRTHGLDATADAMTDEVLGRRSAVSREDVFSIGAGTISRERAELLFCASLAWGLGTKARRLDTRIRAYAEEKDRALDHLVKAWEAVRAGSAPEQCYRHLITTRGRPRVPWFGAAFATKYLYFATGPREKPSCLILDAVVAAALERTGVWPDAPTHAWWASTYERYCSLLSVWAEESSADGAVVFPDQIEMALFEHGRA